MADLQEQQTAEPVEEASEGVAEQFAAADAAADPNVEEQLETPSVEEIAVRMGWVPKDKFQGDESKWKPAVDYMLDTPKIHKSLKRKLEHMETSLETIRATNSTILAEKLREQHEQLAGRYAAAVEKGDPDEAWAAANEIKRIQAQAAPKLPAPAPETQAWVQKNGRVMSDPLAQRRAREVCDAYARAGQSTVEQLTNTEAVMRREFPHLFDKPAPSVSAPSSRSTASVTKGGKTAADLPKEARAMADELVESGHIPNADAYAKHYFANLAARRV